MALAPAAAGVLFAHVASAETEPETQREEFFNGFKTEQIKTSGATIKTVYGGNRKGLPGVLRGGGSGGQVLLGEVAAALAYRFLFGMVELLGVRGRCKDARGG